MENINIVFIDLASESRKRVDNLNSIRNLNVSLFESVKDFELYYERHQEKINFLFINEELITEDLNFDVPHLFSLNEESVSKNNNFNCIDRFIGNNELYDLIKSYSLDSNAMDETIFYSNAKTKIICFYSPVGGSGKTCLSMLMGMILSKKFGFKVCYLNLEKNSSQSSELKDENHIGLSELFMTLKMAEKKFLEIFNKAKMNDDLTGIDYLSSPIYSLEYEEISNFLIRKFLSKIKNMSLYDYIIIDTASEFNGFNTNILKESDGIVMPYINDRRIIKLINFLKEIDNDEELKSKIHSSLVLLQNQNSGNASFETHFPVYLVDRIDFENERYNDASNIEKGLNAMKAIIQYVISL